MTFQKLAFTATCLAACFLFAGSSELESAPFHSVDFGPSAVNTGLAGTIGVLEGDGPFVGQDLLSATHSTSEGNLTIALTAANGGFFDRGSTTDSGSFTYGDLYDDWFFDNGNNASISLSGAAIAPNTDYQIRFWAYDHNSAGVTPRKTTFTGTLSTVGGGDVDWTPGAAGSDNFEFSELLLFTSDNTGTINIGVTDSIFIRVPGLEISTVDVQLVPEPMSMGLLFIGTIGVALLSRRRS